ncbi:MAG: 5'-nucleotidase C-terminal domain-containing protein [Gemmatimonadales bacterium]
MIGSVTVLAGLLLAVSCGSVALRAQDTVEVVVVATTDVHGHVFHWDYLNDREAPWGLTRAGTIVDSLRRVFPGRVIVVDAGDLIQGSPFATYFAREHPADPDPVITALNVVRYDVATPGNHEFNFGLDVLSSALGDAAFPIVSANIYRLPRDTFAFRPDVILPRGGARVGVTGFTTPGVMIWDRDNVSGRVVVKRIIPAARAALQRLQQQRADLRVVIIHSGMNAPSSYDTTGVGAENVASSLAALPIKPHLVVVGHSHRVMIDTVINGVHFIQPRPWARSLAIAHVWLVRAGTTGSFRVARISGEQISLENVAPNPVVTRRLEDADRRVRIWVSTPLAESEGDWSARYARAGDTPIIDFVNEVQRRLSGADLSSTAAFNPGAHLGPGPVRLRDVAAVYPYENTLKAVRIDGASLRDYLEHSASYFRTYVPGEPIVNDSVPGFNFDIVGGVDYTIDLSRPVGSRIRQLTWQGRLVQSSDTFRLALNNYRQRGGGGFDMLKGLPVVYDRSENIRDLLAEAVRSAGRLRSDDYFRPSWRIMPPEAADAARKAFEPRVEQPSAVAKRDSVSAVFAPRPRDRVEAAPPPAKPFARLKFRLEVGEDSPLERLVADAFRNGARTHFALLGAGGIRTGLPAGPVSRRGIEGVLTRDERLVRFQIRGSVLYGILEQVVGVDRIAVQVSGFDVWYEPRRKTGKRVRRLRFPDGREVRKKGTYTLTLPASLIPEFAMLGELTYEATGLTEVSALEAYIRKLRQPVEAPGTSRFHRNK